jgi:hypothetical protein
LPIPSNGFRRKKMFGFGKKKVQLSSVEDYLRTREMLGDGPAPKPAKRPPVNLARVRSLVGPALGVLFILVVVGAALSQFNGLRSEIAEMKAQKSEDLKELRVQLAEFLERADKSEKRAAQLAERVSSLEKALQAETAERIRAEQAAKKAAMAAAAKPRNAAGRTVGKPLPKSAPGRTR